MTRRLGKQVFQFFFVLPIFFLILWTIQGDLNQQMLRSLTAGDTALGCVLCGVKFGVALRTWKIIRMRRLIEPELLPKTAMAWFGITFLSILLVVVYFPSIPLSSFQIGVIAILFVPYSRLLMQVVNLDEIRHA